MPETAARNDPFPGFRFVLEIEDISVAGFSECTGLDVEVEVEEYREGGENRFVHKFPGRRRHRDIVLKRGVVGRELWDWFIQQELGEIDPIRLSIIINAYDPNGQSLVFEVHDAFARKWQGPALSAGSSAVAMETLTLSHQGLRLSKSP